MKLKENDIVIENDGIVTIIYKIVKVGRKIAIGSTEFEGKTYYTTYQREYKDPKNILPLNAVSTDLTRRELKK